MEKKASPPGEPAKRVRRRRSDYRDRLREKQRLKRSYGVTETQFRRYLQEAEKAEVAFGNALLGLLETRLDNVLRRLGYVWSLNLARQLINQGHVLVDGEKVDIPSYNVTRGSEITLEPDALQLSAIQEALEVIPLESIPSWLAREGTVGKMVRELKEDDLRDDINVRLVSEFY